MTVPMVGMLLYNNIYAIHVVRGQVADSYQNMLSLYMNQIDSALNDVDSYMISIAGSGYDLMSLGQAKTETDYYSAKIYLYNKLSKDIALYKSLDSFFVYVPGRQDAMDIAKTYNFSFEEKERIQRHIIDLIRSGQIPNGISSTRWRHDRIGQNYYLINIVRSGDVYLGGWVQTDQLLSPLKSLQIGEGGGVLLADDQGEEITNTNLLSENGIHLNRNLNDYELLGTNRKFLVVGAPSAKGDFWLIALIPDRHILAKLPYLQSLIWIITVASIFFIPIGLYFMRQFILVPLNRILTAMKRVRDGDWSNRVVLPDTSEEFKLLGDSFNEMMNEINTLRVNVYEEQLNKQREELQRLQLQVNPHFFLNSLNIVYNLAKVKNYELIQEMTMALIHYFRFMFRSNTSFVKLKDELDHTGNYLRIQGLRFPGQLTWSIDAPDYVSDVPVPPLVVQSFVENSIKHAVTLDKPVHVSVRIDFADDENESKIAIVIKDTGPGFPEHTLRLLREGKKIENERGEHTGIWNVQRRLRLLYGDKVFLNFDNDNKTGGAVVEIVLPANPEIGGVR